MYWHFRVDISANELMIEEHKKEVTKAKAASRKFSCTQLKNLLAAN